MIQGVAFVNQRYISRKKILPLLLMNSHVRSRIIFDPILLRQNPPAKSREINHLSIRPNIYKIFSFSNDFVDSKAREISRLKEFHSNRI